MRFNRFVFLNRPVLSLETHLGVTASPQAPFPADFVTLPVFSKSPPLRLTPSRSRGRACSLLQHRLRRAMHSRHAQATRPPFGRASLAGRTVGEVGDPQLIRAAGLELSVDSVEWRARCHRGSWSDTSARAPRPADPRAHQPLDRAASHDLPLAAELPPDLARTVDAEILLVTRRISGISARHAAAAAASAPDRPARLVLVVHPMGRSATARRSTRPRARHGGRR